MEEKYLKKTAKEHYTAKFYKHRQLRTNRLINRPSINNLEQKEAIVCYRRIEYINLEQFKMELCENNRFDRQVISTNGPENRAKKINKSFKVLI